MISVVVASLVWLAALLFGALLAFCWLAPQVKRERGYKEFFCYWMNQNAKVIQRKQAELTIAEKAIVSLRRQVPGRDNTGRFTKKPKDSAAFGSE